MKFTRRGFLKRTTDVAGSVPLGIRFGAPLALSLGAICPNTVLANAESELTDSAVYLSFGPQETAFVEMMVNIMCPADKYTPSGVDCGLAIFIDRQLAGGFGKAERMYCHGPWEKGKKELGYQLPLNPEQYFFLGITTANEKCIEKHGRIFCDLGLEEANIFLSNLADGVVVSQRIDLKDWFNELIYPLFIQACFSDPIYGGNKGKVFWRMIGYPGLPALYSRDMVEFRGKQHPLGMHPKSMEDFV